MTIILKAIPADVKLPDNGGGYKDYLSKIDGLINYQPYMSMSDSVRSDIENLIKNKNDGKAWLTFAASSILESWKALPKGVRDDAMDAAYKLLDDALNDIGSIVEDAIGATATTIGEAVPIIGTIVKAVVDLVLKIYEAHVLLNKSEEAYSLVERDDAMSLTIGKYKDPNEWILHQMKVENYLEWKGYRVGKGDWDLRPCFGRNSEESWLMFNEVGGQPDSGSCGGVPYKCDIDMNCEPNPKSGEGKDCVRYLGISSLYFPFWSPSYPSIPVVRPALDSKDLVFDYSYSYYDMNRILIERQMALLTVPAVNLKVDGEMVQRFADRFKVYWDSSYKQFGNTLLKIDKHGNAISTAKKDRVTIDVRFDENNAPSSSNKRKFYYDKDGLIQPYSGSGADVSEWGIRAKGGKYGDDYVGISAGSYNAVIGNTLAFFSARANFLRNGLVMKGMLQDYNVNTFWPDVRSAIQYSANYGKMLPTAQAILQQPGRMEKPGRYSSDVERVRKGSSKSSMPILLIGGGVLAIMALKGRK